MWPAVDILGQWVYVASACVFVLLSAGACWRGWRYDRARGRPRCYKCGYPVAPDDAQAVTEAVGRVPCEHKAKRLRGSTREPGGSAAHASRAGCLSNQPKGADAGITEGGSGTWACPECGWVPRRVKDLTRTRRSRRWLAVSLLLLIGASSCWYAIHVQFRRYKLQEPLTTAAVPTTWWLLVLPHSSGDEDIIVYNRAYPQRMIAGKTRAGLLDSTRSVQSTFFGPNGRFGSASDQSSAMPAWQHRWATRVFASSMQDEHRPSHERADRVWFYASFSGVDTPAEEQRLLSLLTETDEDLLFAVLFECFLRGIHTDAVANAAARAVAEPSYSRGMRDFACELLGACGPLAIPHLERWISTGGLETAYYISDTVVAANIWAMSNDRPIQPHLEQMLRMMFSSPWHEHQCDAVWIIEDYYDHYWMSPDAFYALFLMLKADFEDMLGDLDRLDREPAVTLISSCPEVIGDHFGADDLRTVEAWGWLSEQPGDDVAEKAASGFRDLAWTIGYRDEENSEAYDRLVELIELALQRDVSDEAREMLLYAQDVLED